MLRRKGDLLETNYPDSVYADSNGYVFDIEEWDLYDSFTTDMSFLQYHLSDMFVCDNHEACPGNAFCKSSTNRCSLCYDCVFDVDGIGGVCPEKCPTLCSGLIPLDTCPSCGVSLKSFSRPNVPIISNITENSGILSWCSETNYTQASSESSAEVTINFYTDPEAITFLYERTKSYSIKVSKTTATARVPYCNVNPIF